MVMTTWRRVSTCICPEALNSAHDSDPFKHTYRGPTQCICVLEKAKTPAAQQ